MSQELKPCESCAAPKHQQYPQRNGDSICAACGATYGLATAPVPPAAMDESNFAPGGWKIERTPDDGFCLSHPTHGRGFFSDRGHKPAVVVSRFLDSLLIYGPTAERLQAENASLQQRLNIADQRVDDLQAALQAAQAPFPGYPDRPPDEVSNS